MTRSGPQRTAMGKPDASITSTAILRLGDQVARAPSGVADQSFSATSRAISFSREPPNADIGWLIFTATTRDDGADRAAGAARREIQHCKTSRAPDRYLWFRGGSRSGNDIASRKDLPTVDPNGLARQQ